MTDKPVTVTPELLPCRKCGAICRVETWAASEVLMTETNLWMCSESTLFDGECDGDAYVSAEAWNTRTAHAPSQHSELADRLAINTIVANLLAPLEPDFPERIRIGNEACTAILSALRQSPAERRDAWEAAQKCRRHGSNSGVYAISDQDCTCGIAK